MKVTVKRTIIDNTMQTRKIIQTFGIQDDVYSHIYALCDDGTMWNGHRLIGGGFVWNQVDTTHVVGDADSKNDELSIVSSQLETLQPYIEALACIPWNFDLRDSGNMDRLVNLLIRMRKEMIDVNLIPENFPGARGREILNTMLKVID